MMMMMVSGLCFGSCSNQALSSNRECVCILTSVVVCFTSQHFLQALRHCADTVCGDNGSTGSPRGYHTVSPASALLSHWFSTHKLKVWKPTNQRALDEADGMTSAPFGLRGWCARAERKRGAERARDREEEKKLPAGRYGVTNYDLSQEKNNNKSLVFTVTVIKLRTLTSQVSHITDFSLPRPGTVLKIGKIKPFFSGLTARGRSPAPRLNLTAGPAVLSVRTFIIRRQGTKRVECILPFCTHTHCASCQFAPKHSSCRL